MAVAQHSARYLFVDVDALVTSVTFHVQTQPLEFAKQLETIAIDNLALDPQRLTSMLEDARSVVACRKGSFFKPHVPDGNALKALGWEMKQKGAASHRTLENLFDRTLQDAGASLSTEVRTVVLATGFVTPSVLSSLETFLQANWRVQLFFPQRCQQASLQQARRTYGNQLEFVYIDRFIQDLLVDRQDLVSSHPAAAAREQSVVDKRTRALQATPSQYSAGTRQRFVFMDFDNITAGLYSSHRLYQRVSGARSAWDLYVNLQALTARICGDDAALVQKQLATYYNSNEAMAQSLTKHQWQVQKQETVSDTTLQLELFSHLIASTEDSKTLVLVTGDGNIAANNKSFKAIVDKYLQQNWFVEIHAWTHALSESYIDFQRAYPQHVVVRPLDAVLSDLVSLKWTAAVPTTGSAPSAPTPSAVSSPELLALTRQLQQMQDAFVALQVDSAQRGELLQQNAALASQIRAQEDRLEAERVASLAHIAQTESDARLAQRMALQERELHLTCPITCDIFEDPVTVSCCGKTFSRAALACHRNVSAACPWCRSPSYTSLVNRDIASLVVLLKQQQAALTEAEALLA